MLNRRKFVGAHLAGIFGLMPFHFSKLTGNYARGSGRSNDPVHALYPTTHHDDVRAIVGASHTQLDKVKEMVDRRPELAKAVWDWGFGDWESALGAASHMGRKDIANVLIEHGARPNIFTYAMMGKMTAVQQMIEDMPGVQNIPGPHGISLLSHAQMRLRTNRIEPEEREQQEALVDYLLALGDADPKAISLDISEQEQKAYLGQYTFGAGPDEYFKITLNSRGMLFLSRGDYTGRVLLRTGQTSFAPGGAPSVQIDFKVVDNRAVNFVIHDPIPVLEATRTG